MSWTGIVVDAAAKPVSGAVVELTLNGKVFRATSDASGHFAFQGLGDNTYRLSVIENGKPIASPTPIAPSLHRSPATLSLLANGLLTVVYDASESAKSGGEKLSSHAVSEIPLNKRDFSQLLLLAAGTATDTNGASNYTQQFAINGQRGVEATFAVDGADASDPELGGATFTNFNVDAVQEIQSSSGWMPAEIGRGGAGYTNIVTRTGTNALHGSVFEFLRNSALDARNYFDHASPANPGRIPPFRRNEFGFTNGGPVVLPHLYDGRGKTFYFGEYQGFRQVLGTTQVFPVPTAEERAGTRHDCLPGRYASRPRGSPDRKGARALSAAELPAGRVWYSHFRNFLECAHGRRSVFRSHGPPAGR